MSFQAVRVSGANTRFMMNGRVFKLGNMVDRPKGLVFKEAYPDKLVFVDADGYRYERPL